MAVHRYDVAGFLDEAGPHLRATEDVNGLALGVVLGVADGSTPCEGPPWLLRVDAPEYPPAWAFRTPPAPLGLVHPFAGAAVDALVDDLAGQPGGPADVPSVAGPPEAVDRFAAAWGARTGARLGHAMAQTVQRLDAVVAPPRVPGRLRRAEPTETALVGAWVDAFSAETGAVAIEPGKTWAVRRVAAGQVWLWDDGGPVSLAAWGRPTPRGASVGPVYTPQERRGRGYAAALVAGLSQHLLERGRSFLVLFTDAGNPTSNALYARLGYRVVGGSRMCVFA